MWRDVIWCWCVVLSCFLGDVSSKDGDVINRLEVMLFLLSFAVGPTAALWDYFKGGSAGKLMKKCQISIPSWNCLAEEISIVRMMFGWTAHEMYWHVRITQIFKIPHIQWQVSYAPSWHLWSSKNQTSLRRLEQVSFVMLPVGRTWSNCQNLPSDRSKPKSIACQDGSTPATQSVAGLTSPKPWLSAENRVLPEASFMLTFNSYPG